MQEQAAQALEGWIAPWAAAEHERQERQRQQRRSLRAGVLADLDAAAEARFDRSAAPVAHDATEAEIQALAVLRARAMAEEIAQQPGRVTRRWLCWLACQLEANPLPPFDPDGAPLDAQMQGMVGRVTCPHWWRRQLRRAAGRKREAVAQAAGRVSRVARSPYVTNDSATRYERQQAKSRAMLERTRLVSADGEEITLLAAFEAGTGNPAIRRGELMTRIKGCEAWATAKGMVGEFATLTTPSRFHSTGHAGKANPKWDGSSPRDGQAWLCGMWAKVRAKLGRMGLRVLGFRIAEPHHDGTPHWHALWWAPAAEAARIRAVVLAYWLSDAGDEPGAEQHRAKFERIDAAKGGACAYLAKYIAKNIDDAGRVGVEGHTDEAHGVQMEIEGGSNGYARRVAAWASLHGIRQFQALGQPPVTVWRELRRIPAATAAQPDCLIAAALVAVHRDGERRACWRGYLQAQGGAMLKRGEYRLGLATKRKEREGRYGATVADCPVGVHVHGYNVTYASERKEWRPKHVDLVDWVEKKGGTLAALAMVSHAVRHNVPPEVARRARLLGNWASASPQGAQPWTRSNNCTGQPGHHLKAVAGTSPDDLLHVAGKALRAHLQARPGGQPEKPEPKPWHAPPKKSQPQPAST